MKSTIYILYCLLLPLKSLGQDSSHVAANRLQFLIQLGATYKIFLDNKHIETTPYNYGDEFATHQYERFNKVPTFGFSAGLLFTYNFNKRVGIASGLLYFLRKVIFETNQDTVIKYGNGSIMRDIHNVLKFEYSDNNIEIPIMVKYSAKKFTFYAGSYFSLITYKKATYIYVVNQYPSSPQWTTSNKTVYEFEMPLKIFPTFQASYEVQIKNLKINPYLAFYYAIKKNKNDFYLQTGVNLPLVKNKN